MKEYALILLGTILVNNYVLVKFLGLCPFMGVSRKLETAMGMGLATTFVLTLSSICAYLTDHYLLIPLGLEYLRTIAFILVMGAYIGVYAARHIKEDRRDHPPGTPSAMH